MTTTKNIAYIFILFITVILFAIASTAFADHEAMVAGEVIPLADANLGHGENCDDVHYHGDLNGKPDPAPDGCGHGVVTILSHDENDESIIPKTEAEEDDGKPGLWDKFKGWVGDVIDVAAQAVGLPGPKTVYETVDIVEDASPSIKENVDNIKEYREGVEDDEDTLGLYDTSTEGLEDWKFSKWFFDWVHGN